MGLPVLALSLQSPTEFALSEVSPGCPPVARRSPTTSFLLNACQETCYSALSMWLARGQGLAADRLASYLTGVMTSWSLSSRFKYWLPEMVKVLAPNFYVINHLISSLYLH